MTYLPNKTEKAKQNKSNQPIVKHTTTEDAQQQHSIHRLNVEVHPDTLALDNEMANGMSSDTVIALWRPSQRCGNAVN